MDPYLEPFWGDVHAGFIVYASEQLQGRLPHDLRARVQERVYVDSPNPLSEPVTETFITTIDIGSGRHVVTVIEVLSPANKRRGPGRDLYLQKQGELIEGKVSLVEIDLLRAGQWLLPVAPGRLPRSHLEPYRILVRRGWKRSTAEFYSVPLRQRLPGIRVPLRETDEDVPLDLQPVLDHCYDAAGFQDDIDYELEPDPPLDADDAAWADALLREKGLRRRPAAPRSRRGRKRKDS
jgi:hypothetical protein